MAEKAARARVPETRERSAGSAAKPAAGDATPAEQVIPRWARQLDFGLEVPAGGATWVGDPPGPFGVVVDEGTAPGPGQVIRGAFMARLEARVRAVADAELAPVGRTARDCPYLEAWLAFYRTRPSAHVERAIRRYAAEAVPTASGLVEAVEARVRRAVRRWRETGAITGIPAESPLLGLAPASPAAPAARPGAATPAAGAQGDLRLELGAGEALDPGLRAAAEAGLRQPLGAVRVHTGSRAATLASEHGARAFTIGQDVVFGSGEYRPGTLLGDALVAHELAHAVQQRDLTTPAQAFSADVAGPLEVEANRAAAGVLLQRPAHAGRLDRWADGLGRAAQGALESLRGATAAPGSARGLQLQRCGKGAPDESSFRAPDLAFQEAGPAALDPGFDPTSSPGVWPVATRGAAGEQVFMVDGDGDQSAELRVTLKPKGSALTVDLTQLSSGQTLSSTFDLSAAPAATLAPRVLQVSDGRGPTRIALDAELGFLLELWPPDPAAAQTVYTASVRHAQTERKAIYTFPKETRLTNPVFQAAAPQEFEGHFTIDLLVGAYADPFRLTVGPGAPATVQVTVSPMVNGEPVGGQSAVVLGVVGPRKVAVVERGGRLGVDLDGDGAADLTLHDRLTAQSSTGQAGAARDARLNRDHAFRGVSRQGELDLGFFQVRDGNLLPVTPAGMVQLPGDRVRAVVGEAGFQRVRSGMLQKAVADGVVRWELATAWDDASAATDRLRQAWDRSQSPDAATAASGKQELPPALQAERAAVARYQALLEADAGGEGNVDWVPEVESEGTRGPNPYTGAEYEAAKYRWQSTKQTRESTLTLLLEALGRRAVGEALPLWDAAAVELDRWVVSRLARGTLKQEFAAASEAAAVEVLASQQGATDFALVFRSVEDRRFALRQRAADAKLLDPTTLSLWRAFSDGWAALQAAIGGMRARPGAISEERRQAATKAFGELQRPVLLEAQDFRDAFLAEAGGKGRAEGEFNGPDDSLSGYDNVYTGEHWDITFFKNEVLDRPADVSGLVSDLTLMRWDAAAADYAATANRLDGWAASRLATGSAQDKAAGTQLTQLVKLSAELEKAAQDAGANRPRPVNAVFYPEEDYVEKLRLTGMPLMLFTYHDAGQWYLKDLTNPDKVFTNRLDYEAKHGDEPPPELFEKLDTKDHFPRGFVRYKLPDPRAADGSVLRPGRTGVVTTTSPTSPADWFGYVSAALGATALILATGGVGALAVTACVVAAGATGAIAAGLDIHEKREQGILDATTVAVDVVQIIANVAGGAGAVAREVKLARDAVVAAQLAGGAAELSPASLWLAKWGTVARLYKPIQIAGAAADAVNLIAYTEQAAQELEAIVTGPGTDADRLRASALLLGRFAATGALTILSLRGTVREVQQHSTVELGFGRDGRPILRVAEGTFAPAQYQARLQEALAKAGHDMADVEVKVIAGKDFDALHADGDAVVTVRGEKVQVLVRDGALLSTLEEEALHVRQARNPALRPLFAALDETLLGDWKKLTPAQKVAAVRAKLELELDAQRSLVADMKAKPYLTDADVVRVDEARQNIENLRGKYAELAELEPDYLARGDARGSKLFDEPPQLFAKRSPGNFPIDRRTVSLEVEQFKKHYRAENPTSRLTDEELEDYYVLEGKRLNPATGRLRTPDEARDVTPSYEAKYKQIEGKDTKLKDQLVLSSEGAGAGAEEVKFGKGSDLEKRRADALARRDQHIEERDKYLSGKKKPPAGETRESAAAKVGAQVNEQSRKLGEVWAEAFMKEHFPGFKRVYPPEGAPSRSGDFDEIWEGTAQNAKGKFVVQQVVIEAKGGGAQLGSRRLRGTQIRAQQGNRAYFAEILQNMQDSADDVVRGAAERMKATGMKNVRYVLVKGTVSVEGGKSTSNVAVVREFDLGP